MTKNKKPKRIKIKLYTFVCMKCCAVGQTSNENRLYCIRCVWK